MKELFNFCPFPGEEYNLNQIKKINISGIELLVYEDFPGADISPEYVTGVHLAYWPDWLDFYRGKRANDKYGSVENWFWAIKKNILSALKFSPEYLIWHVSQSSVEEVFTMRYQYDSMWVVQEAANVFNKINHIIPDNVTVLFENLWHPGLRLTEPAAVDTFFSLINRKNAGIMLDTGHLMLTNKTLSRETRAVAYICKIVEKLGDMKNLIRGIHLNCSLDSNNREFSVTVPDEISDKVLWERLATLDRHLPFRSCSFDKLFELISPKYLVHELFNGNFAETMELVQIQRKCFTHRR